MGNCFSRQRTVVTKKDITVPINNDPNLPSTSNVTLQNIQHDNNMPNPTRNGPIPPIPDAGENLASTATSNKVGI